MNLRPRVLPVYCCCCDPARRLGWVPVSVKQPGPIRFRVGNAASDLFTGQVTAATYIETSIEWLSGSTDGRTELLVVKSGEAPIELWRLVRGFIEDRGPQ